MRAGAAHFVGSYGSAHIGAAYKASEQNFMDYVEHKVTHAALGAASGYALKGDLDGAAAGAIGAAVGEVVGEAFKKYCDQKHLEDGGKLTDIYDAHSDYYKDMVEKGIAVAKLSAATAAALADQDPDVAAMTAGNAVKHNAFFIPLIMVGSAAWTAYEVIEEFYTNGTEAGLKKLGIEIGMYAAGGAVTKLGTKAIMAGAKIAGNPKVGQFIAKIGDQYLPFDSIDAVWKHAVHNSPTLQLAMKYVEKSKLYLGKATQKATHLDQAAGEKVSQLADRGLNHAKKRLGGRPAPKGGAGGPRNYKNNNKKPSDKGKEPADDIVHRNHPENQKPYDPHAMRDLLEKRCPEQEVTSTTLPKRGARGTKYKGNRHPKSKVVYTEKGLPDFDKHMVYEMQVPHRDFFPKAGDPRTLDKLRSNHMRQATRQLRQDINDGKVSRNLFQDNQLKAIKGGEAQIPDLTWEHNPRAGRMQLVSKKEHTETPHVGAIGLYKKKRDE